MVKRRQENAISPFAQGPREAVSLTRVTQQAGEELGALPSRPKTYPNPQHPTCPQHPTLPTGAWWELATVCVYIPPGSVSPEEPQTNVL